MRPGCFFMLIMTATLFCSVLAIDGQDEPLAATAANVRSPRQRLAVLNELVGRWRGVGQPKRGSSRGAWFEKAEWQWDFSGGQPKLNCQIEKGKLARQISITAATTEKNIADKSKSSPDGSTFALTVTDTNNQSQKYVGAFDPAKNRLVALSKPADGKVNRLTITLLNRKRTILLLESRKVNASFWSRTAGIGYTREGTSLAVAGSSERECVVTGGRGTIKVSHEGKTYYVCCRGCKQAFEDDPAETLNAWKRRLADRKAKLAK